MLCLLFTAWHSYASTVLGVVILSVFLSVCHTHALWLIQRTYRRYFYTIWKGSPSSFLPPNSGLWATSPSTFNGRSKWPTPFKSCLHQQTSACNISTVRASEKGWTRMWASAQPDGHRAEHRWRPLFNAAKFGWRSLLDCHAVMLPRCESRWN